MQIALLGAAAAMAVLATLALGPSYTSQSRTDGFGEIIAEAEKRLGELDIGGAAD